MRKFMLLTLSAAALVLLSWPPAVQAQSSEALSLTNQAIKELADYPGRGKRETAYVTPEDFVKNYGADVGQIKKAAGILQDALAKARASNASQPAIMKLEEAVAYCGSTMHKECRLYALGALYHLCQGAGGEGCDKVPKFGSYVAP